MKIPDLGLFLPALFLSIIGLIIVFSISPGNFPSQMIFFIIGVTIFFAITQVDYRMIMAVSSIVYIASILALILTLIIGSVTRGSTRWLPLGNYRLQVSELMKPFILILLAQLSTIFDLRKFPKFLTALGVILIPAVLIFLQPDLGSTVMLLIIGGMAILTMRPRKRFIFLIIFILLIASPIAWNMLHDYQRSRVMAFLNPNADPLGSSYNQIQATIAAGSGQIWGKGLGKGTQSHLQFLPEKHTDFFFASMAEEFGFIGSIAVISLFATISGRLIHLAGLTNKTSHRVIFLGVFVMFFVQSMIHIGINIGALPVTGLTLPLMSVGGSSFLASWIGLGFASSVSRDIKMDRAIFLR